MKQRTIVIQKNGRYEDIFLCGMYEYEENEKTRSGSIALLQSSISQKSMVKVSIDTSGVFDAKWLSSNSFLSAESDGCVKLFSTSERFDSILKKHEIKVTNEFALCVGECGNKIISGSSSGEIVIIEKDETKFIESFENCHSYPFSNKGAEIWTLNGKKESCNFVTGGEDQKTKIWDIRQMQFRKPAIAISSNFSAGVCCAKFIGQSTDNMLIVGSYDGHIRLFDLRNTKSCIFSLNCFAGPWDIKQHPLNDNMIGVACMRAGFFSLNVEGLVGEQSLLDTERIVISSYPGIRKSPNYESLAYGVEFLTSQENNNEDYKILCASFYDKKIIQV